MYILKILGVLFFLITTGGKAITISNQEATSFASFTEVAFGIQDIEADISSDDNQELSESTISGFFNTPGVKVYLFGSLNFYFSSLHETRLIEQYINISKYIDPGLEKSDIIFPFHTFS